MTEAQVRLNDMLPSGYEQVGEDFEPLFIATLYDEEGGYAWRIVKDAPTHIREDGWVYGLYSDGSAIAINLV